MKSLSVYFVLALWVAAPASAAIAHRCDVAWLKNARDAVSRGDRLDDPNYYLTTEVIAGGQRAVIDIDDGPNLCDATVWNYLAFLDIVPRPVLDFSPRRQPVGELTRRWNDAALKQDWASGLSEQIKILLAVDDLYQEIDSLGQDTLKAADTVVNAAVRGGVVSRKDGASLFELKKYGLTGDALLGEQGYEAVPAAPGSTNTPSAARLNFAFSQLLADAPTTSKMGPKPLKPGPALLDFRRAVIVLANELAVRSVQRDLMQKAGVDAMVTSDFSPSPASAGTAKAALIDAGNASMAPAGTETLNAAYETAIKFITDPVIRAGDDDSPHDSAALSRLDYGLRNLIALRAAAVDLAVDETTKRLAGRSVAETLAVASPDPKSRADRGSAMMADLVLEHLGRIKDYHDLSVLYGKNSADLDWMNGFSGKAVIEQLNILRGDAEATTVVNGPDGRTLEYSIHGHMMTDTSISVADLDRIRLYREAVAEAIAQNIASYPLSVNAQAVLAANRGDGASGTQADQ